MVAGGADTQLGLLGAGAVDNEYTVVGGTFWQNTVLLDSPLIDPEARLRTLCHVSPGEWMLRGSGSTPGWRCGGSVTRSATARSAWLGSGADPYELMEAVARRRLLGS